MTMLDFETLAEYLDDRYTTAEVVDALDISMVSLIDCLYDYIQEHKQEELNELIGDEGDNPQLELPF